MTLDNLIDAIKLLHLVPEDTSIDYIYLELEQTARELLRLRDTMRIVGDVANDLGLTSDMSIAIRKNRAK